MFQHTAARRRLAGYLFHGMQSQHVSTHSRPKAAGTSPCAYRCSIQEFQHTAARRRLVDNLRLSLSANLFQHTAARRRLGQNINTGRVLVISFNTQPPEGGWVLVFPAFASGYGFNTQPPEGGWRFIFKVPRLCRVSTHSRPKAAGHWQTRQRACRCVSTHSRPKAAGFPFMYIR